MTHEDYQKEVASEKICGLCGLEMEEIKRKKKNKFDKERTVYECKYCGNHFRKRTQNEILRDLGMRN